MDRRDFLLNAGAVGAATNAFAAKPAAKMSGRVLGANDRINVGVVGVGGRGSYVANVFAKVGADTNKCQIVKVCDTYQKRVNANVERHKAKGTLDWREVVTDKDIDAVIVATPDHWHAKVALEAMDNGKDVYLEKPMCHTVDEVKQLIDTVKETKRIIQVGSQTTSGDQWHQAKKYIADGAIGKMLLSQGSYHRNSIEGEWNYTIDKDAGPNGKGENYIDWKTWLGPATKRDFDADRFFRFRKYWDYSGGIATDLFFHVVAPMNICWGTPQFPHKVMAGGGIYSFKDREVPDTFHLIAEYNAGHSLVLSSSMANSQHIPGLIRGHEGTIIMVEHGRFEGFAPHITLKPEVVGRQGVRKNIAEGYKFGQEDVKIPVKELDTMRTHVTNFLDCMVSRQKPTLDVETAGRAQVLITMAVQSYRQGKVLYFDEQKFKIVDKAPAHS
jgi:predicted dehydrogenase